MKNQENVATFSAHTGKVTSLSFSENGYYLATGSEDATVRLWDLRKLSNFHTIKMDAPVKSVKFDFSGSYLGAAAGNVVNVYQNKTWTEIVKFAEQRDIVTDIGFGNDASYVATVSMDRHLDFIVYKKRMTIFLTKLCFYYFTMVFFRRCLYAAASNTTASMVAPNVLVETEVKRFLPES